jgi:hypothetical protein
MKKSVAALLIMVGLVGGMFIAGCGGGGEEPDTDTTMQKAVEQTGEQMEQAAKDMEEKAEQMQQETEGSATQ